MTARSKSMTDGCRTVGTVAARALMDFALSKGCSLAALRERSGIRVADLRDVEGRIPFEQYATLMLAAKEQCDDPAFALHFGESDAGIEATFACMMGIFSPTMAGSLADYGGDDRLRMVRNGDEVWFIDLQNDEFPEGPEASFARAVCASRRLFPGMAFLKAIHFKQEAPAYRAEYERIFQVPVVFGSDRNALLAHAAWLDQGLESPSPRVFELMKSRAAMLSSTRTRVEAVLTNALPNGEACIDVVAGKLAMGRHTLFRKLRAEGVTFKQVLAELRQKLATQYLLDRKMPVHQTAYLLGFSDAASFSRAYKRWTGRSPRRVQ